MVELEHTRSLLEQMGLHTAAQLLDAQLEISLHSQQTYLQFLHELLFSEQQQRQRKSLETRLKLARLPHRKGLEEFDFEFQPSIDKRQIEELGTLAFVARTENVIFLGPPGVGKTHLAVGLACKAGSRNGGVLHHAFPFDCRSQKSTVAGKSGAPMADLPATCPAGN